MMGISLKQLRYFEALARTCHFGRAADRCAISQPALSLQVKELEELLGAPLVERDTRHVRLTGLGEAVAARARVILQAVDDLGDLARAARGPLGGRLRIGAIPTVAPYLLPTVIHALVRHYPDVDLLPREAVTPILIGELMSGQLDAAIVALPLSEPALCEQALFDEEFLLVRPVTDAEKPVPKPDRLREMRLLLLGEGHCFRDQAISFCKLSTAQARDLIEGSSLSTLVQMVGAGIGVTLIPEMAVAVETRSADVSVARLAKPRPTRTIGMVWRKSNPLSEELARAAGFVRAAVQDRALLA